MATTLAMRSSSSTIEDPRLHAAIAVAGAAGRRSVKRAPPPRRSPTSSWPPCASTICRAIGEPEAGAARAGREEGLEDARAQLGGARRDRSRRPSISTVAVAGRARRGAPRRRGRRASSGVREQADQHLAHQVDVGAHAERRAAAAPRSTRTCWRASSGPARRSAPSKSSSTATGAGLEAERAREREQRADDARQAIDLGGDEAAGALRRRRRPRRRVSPRLCAAERMTASGFRTSCAIVARELPERGELLALHEPGARGLDRLASARG